MTRENIAGLSIFLGIWAATFLCLRAATFRRLRFSVRPLIIEIKPDDPRLPNVTRRYFDIVAGELAELGFRSETCLINARVSPGTTAYLALFSDQARQVLATAMMVCAPSKSAVDAAFMMILRTEFTDGSEIVTDNLREPFVMFPDPEWRATARIPGMRDFSAMFQLHRQQVEDRQNAEPVTIPLGSDLAAKYARETEAEYQRLAETRLLELMPDGDYYRLSGMQVTRWTILSTIPGFALLLGHKRKPHEILRSAGLPADYPKTSFGQTLNEPEIIVRGIRTARDSIRGMWKRSKLFLISLSVVLMVLCYQLLDTGPAELWISLVFLGLVACLFILHKLPPPSMAHACRSCGHNRGPGHVWCQICGEGWCLRCGYNLFGNKTGRCPECGSSCCLKCGLTLNGVAGETCPECGITAAAVESAGSR